MAVVPAAHRRLLVAVALVLLLAGPCRGSPWHCRGLCARPETRPAAPELSWWLREVMGWDAAADCEYRCMLRTETAAAVARGETQPARKYFGKWPFVRVLGMQEPASVAFSIANGLVWAVALARLLLALWDPASVPALAAGYGEGPGKTVLRVALCANLAASVNAWVWSSVFHSRDLPWTERLDYFSGTLAVLGNLNFLLARVVSARLWPVYAATVSVVFARHVHYLAWVRFDYGYNMWFNIAIAGLQVGMLLLWYARERRVHPCVWLAPATGVATGVALLFEVFDFPPLWFVLDAHSLWHLTTVPIALAYWHLLQADMQWVAAGRGPSSPAAPHEEKKGL